MRRLIVAVALALLVPAAASARPPGPVAPPVGPPPAPLPQAQAEALVAAPAAVPGGSQTWAVSPQEALGAASSPGAAVFVAPGLSLQQAVGAAPGAGSVVARPAAAAAAAVGCSANRAYRTWGTWPYEQQLSDTTYWCAVYGDHITYYSSTVNATGTLCNTGWTSSQVISGGIGYSWFVVRSSGGWSCPTVVPWLNLHPSHYMDYSRNAWGSTEYLGSS